LARLVLGGVTQEITPSAVGRCSRILRPGSANDVEYRIPKDFVSLSHGILFHRINAFKKGCDEQFLLMPLTT
jgi:hypothetical protein